MYYLVMIGQLILSLSILIVLHELGHFLPAKWFKTKVEKFYLFFDPWFSLFKVKKGDTEYGIGWLPLGGYVKIAGMIDESFDTEALQGEPQPWEFRSKPAWQRLIIMIGGVTVNFILGFFIWGMILWHYGEEYLPAANVTTGIYADSLGREMGFRDGDKILKIGEKPFVKFDDRILIKEIVINNANIVTVLRNGVERPIKIDSKYPRILASNAAKSMNIFMPKYPAKVASVAEGSEAERIGLEAEDELIGLNGRLVDSYGAYVNEARKHKGEDIILTVVKSSRDTQRIETKLSEKGTLGFYAQNYEFFFDMERQEYGFFAGLAAGTKKGWNFLVDQIKAFKQMFTGRIKASESLGGFGSIGKMFGGEWHWERFWKMTAILSLILAFMNLLPIPALDGGHVMFLLWEIVTGKKPSDNFLERATLIGFIIIMGLVLYANGLDIFRAWFS